MNYILSSHSRLGLRAALAAIIAVGIGTLFNLDYPYWSTMTALLVIGQSWGESIEKALYRLGFTILGCIVGWGLFIVTKDILPLAIFCIFISIFCIVYFQPVSYRNTMFFVGVIVVFIFGELRGWSLDVLLTRAYETAIGCGIGVAVSGLFFPVFAHKKVKEDLACTFDTMRQQFLELASTLTQQQVMKPSQTAVLNSNLRKFVVRTRQDFDKASFESMFTRLPRKKMQICMLKLDIVMHYLSSMIELLPTLSKENIQAQFADAITQVTERRNQRFQALIETIEIGKPLNEVPECITRFHLYRQFLYAKRKKIYSYDTLVTLTALYYYSKKMDEVLVDLTNILK